MILSSVFPSLAFLALVSTGSIAQTISISSTASHPIPTSLWGQMYEDISHSGDGGLYAELLQNRAFQQVTPGASDATYAWHSVNGATLQVVADETPVSSALPNSLVVTIPDGASGAVGVGNEGYFGIKVDSSWTYKASLYYRFPSTSSFSGNITVGLQTSTGEVLVSSSTAISGSQTSWEQLSFTLTPSASAESTANNFTVTFDGDEAAGETIHFAMFSLFPPTFKDRENGMRIDLAEALAAMKPAFFRFPGGNNLEGQTIARRWQWNATLGPLVDRPGRWGDWSYINTDGLGILEYLQWCEDLDMEPIMGVWAGFALRGETVPENGLGPYIQQAIDQINFVIGDPETNEYAALRASLGHPEPFSIRYIEIGNEDFFSPNSYLYRWPAFVNNLTATFPDLRFIATTREWDPVLDPIPTDYDVHVYQTPKWFSDNAFYYDDFERNETLYFEGEYAVTSTNSSDIFGPPERGRLVYPTMQGATGEAAFMMGLERNSDIVWAAAYAPLLNHVHGSQWTPNLISFDSTNVYLSASYYVQQLFALNNGDEYLPSTLPVRGGTVHWSVVRKTSVTPNEIIIKIVNTVATPASVSIVFPFDVSSSGTLQLLAGTEKASNTPEAPDTVRVEESTIETGNTFSYSLPEFSLSIITVTAA